MNDLVDFLRARLDEDEAAAKLAAREGGAWTQVDPDRYPGSICSLGGYVVYDEGSPDEYQGAHIARHDPARVLREVAAKLAIIGEHQRSGEWCHECTHQIWPCPALRALAAVYSDHPGYRDEWKP